MRTCRHHYRAKLAAFLFVVLTSCILTLRVSLIHASSSDTLVLVNSHSSAYPEFQKFIQPYLKNFGIPYSMLDIYTTPVGPEVVDYALIIVGHRELDINVPADPNSPYLDTTEQAHLLNAVNSGTGLVNFDNDLWEDGGTPRYQFVQDIFAFGYKSPSLLTGVRITSSLQPMHYITARHEPGQFLSTGGMNMAGIILPEAGDVTALAMSGDEPFLAITTKGLGRAVQWGTYGWMSHLVKGPMYGLDDLVWRSIVWAARKPFLMQGMPPFVTMRVDDVSYPSTWIPIANEFGIKPWVGVFTRTIDSHVGETNQLSLLVNSGDATASIHAFTMDDDFYLHTPDGCPWGNWPESPVEGNCPIPFSIHDIFEMGTLWHTTNNIPISKFVVPHVYRPGSNVFEGLNNWGVEFLGARNVPSDPRPATPGLGTPWLMNGPYRLYEELPWATVSPFFYADFLSIDEQFRAMDGYREELHGKFFNCLTEIHDDAGYEWSPSNTDIAGSIGRGTRQTKRALDSVALATLFTHEDAPINLWQFAPENWRAILRGVTENLAPYNPIYVTMDHACQYVRAKYTSRIASGQYDPVSNEVTATYAGEADMPTMSYLFTEQGGDIFHAILDVPAFIGSTEVRYRLAGPYRAECQGLTTNVPLDGTRSGNPDLGTVSAFTWSSDCPGGILNDSSSPMPILTLNSSPGCQVNCNVFLNLTTSTGITNTSSSTVTILDTVPPSITCPADRIIQCSESTAPSHTGTAAAVDICDANPVVSFHDVVTTGECPQVPVIKRIWTVTDSSRNSSNCLQTIHVVDTTSPIIQRVAATPNTLWPPDHRMIRVNVSATATDNCDPIPRCAITGVTSNEPANDLGDGVQTPDWIITGNLTVDLRAERSGTGNGRIYSIAVACVDACGNNSSVGMTTVTVPHD